jgi:hypothetical protein
MEDIQIIWCSFELHLMRYEKEDLAQIMSGTTEQRYREYFQIAKKITKGDERARDLLHDVLIDLNSNVKWNNLSTKKEQIYFITRTMINQFNSNNSKFQRNYRKFTFEQISNVEQLDEIYEEKPTIEWIQQLLEKEVNNNPENWYNVGLFKMYMSHKKIEPIHKKTRIPKYSIRLTIKHMKAWIKEQWIKEKNGTD